jgi:hypothetical protein
MKPKSTKIAIQDQDIDPLCQHGSYAFIPYTNPAHRSSTNATSQSTNDPLCLKNTSSWTYCGPLLTSALPPSFHSWSAVTMSESSTLLDRLLPLLSFLHTFLSAAGAHHYWLTIRATKPTKEYDVPRWHVDEDFFASQLLLLDPMKARKRKEVKKRNWKLCTTLLGPPTLFLASNSPALSILRDTKSKEKEKMDEHTCTSIRCLGCSAYADTVRSSLATSLSSHTAISLAPNQVAFFRLGDQEGAVHSEPKCDTDRIFVNVVPGEEGELRDLLGRWGMEFPRAWCFGVPVGFTNVGKAQGDNNVIEDEEEGGPIMSVNVAGEYGKWLKKEGFEIGRVFGHVGADTTMKGMEGV